MKEPDQIKRKSLLSRMKELGEKPGMAKHKWVIKGFWKTVSQSVNAGLG